MNFVLGCPLSRQQTKCSLPNSVESKANKFSFSLVTSLHWKIPFFGDARCKNMPNWSTGTTCVFYTVHCQRGVLACVGWQCSLQVGRGQLWRHWANDPLLPRAPAFHNLQRQQPAGRSPLAQLAGLCSLDCFTWANRLLRQHATASLQSVVYTPTRTSLAVTNRIFLLEFGLQYY